MKKIFLIFTVLLLFTFSIKAQQISNNTIGIRFSGGSSFESEISYQKALQKNNRVELGLGLGDNFKNFKAIGLYQWVWPLQDKFNWYTGLGGGFAALNDAALFGAGNIGVEYNFNSPFLVSLDYRQEIKIIGSSGLSSLLAFSIRYKF